MATTLVPLIGPVPGGMELVVILLIAVLLFGANKIPKLARSTGQAMGEFQRGREEVEQELQDIKEGDGSSSSEDTLDSTDDSIGSTDDSIGSTDDSTGSTDDSTDADLGTESETTTDES